MGNKVGSGEAWEPIKKEGLDVVRRDKDSKRVEGGNSSFQGPSGAGR
jgi:hypothetical protein